jgi:hypothetical protein
MKKIKKVGWYLFVAVGVTAFILDIALAVFNCLVAAGTIVL